MTTRFVGILCATGVICGTARADETVAFHVEFSTPIVAPGQPQTIQIWALMDPDVGQPAVWNTLGGSGQTGTVYALFAAWLDLVNVENGETGILTNLQLNPAFSFVSHPGIPNTNGGVTGILARQTPSAMGGQSQANPILIWTATWLPTGYAPRTVTFDTSATTLPIVLLSDIFITGFADDEWAAITGPSSFQVVPGPPVACTLALGALIAGRRRR